MTDLLQDIQRAFGAVRVRDLRLDRTGRRHLADLVADGLVQRPVPGVVAAPGASRELIMARYYGGLLCCQSAASYYGLPVLRALGPPHLIVPKGVRVRPQGRVVLHEDRCVARPGPFVLPVAPIGQALARYLRCDSEAEGPLVALDAALHSGQVRSQDVESLLRGPGSVRARRVLARASGRSRSPLETLTRLQLEDAGLRYRDGVVISGVGEVDFLVESWVVVELDGYTYHADEVQFWLDRRRDRELAAMGFEVLRFTRREVYAGRVVEAVQSVLSLACVSRSRTKPGAVVLNA